MMACPPRPGQRSHHRQPSRRQRLDERRKPAVEILVVAGAKTNTAAAPDCFGTIAIELKVVDPRAAFRQVLGARKEHGMDESALDPGGWHTGTSLP